MASRRNVKYSPLLSDEDNGVYNVSDDDHIKGREFDPRFDYSPKCLDKVPWKSILLALFLLFLGSILLFLSFFILTGHMGGERPQAYGLLALGILAFLPVIVLAILKLSLKKSWSLGNICKTFSKIIWEQLNVVR